ncbi:MAG: hypothetical protein GWM90_27440 [Gemmatimonadetes bacterium]|nr:hypothetical protein [Gemmatimonadota bacterium]NIQ58711.1 hypothetical protein [Gemmatimonadota bacterium]NIU78901.1 hypothetical protein [Gammaproteobacteria bacterium]NIX47666.1 hypothetical protein [Gemmatimonadota bacterium]NIY12040.1 hypothetical protein [Gemmatimonadota bacterium]
MASPDLVLEAEGLIRSLAGVVSVDVRSSTSGIETIHVEAENDEAARHMAGHVRSALLAAMATAVVPGRIHVSVAGARDHPHDSPRHRLRLLRGEDGPARDPDHAPWNAAPGDRDPSRTAQDLAPDILRRPRLVAVDVTRPGDGRVLCRVSLALGAAVHRAEAVAVDLPGAAAQAAAQAAVRALLDAGLDGLELIGLREVEIAGRDYVVVALRRAGVYPRNRSGSAPIVGSPERSAAEATVAAAEQMT